MTSYGGVIDGHVDSLNIFLRCDLLGTRLFAKDQFDIGVRGGRELVLFNTGEFG